MPSRQLYDNLPLYPKWLDAKGVLQHICEAIQPELNKIFDLAESQENLYNLDLCPNNLLDWLGQMVGAAPIDDQWLGLGMNPNWSPEYKRSFLSQIWIYWQIKGTEIGVRQALSLWLRYKSWNNEKLKILFPFGRVPTNALPSWWGYDIPYDYHAYQTYPERKFFGSGEYLQQWRPIWSFLDAEYSWGYDTVWNNTLNYHDAPLQVDSSHLGTNSPWMHFYPEGEEWNQVFPDIHQLNPEIWNSNARVTTFGWKRNMQRCVFPLKRSEFAVDKKTVIEYEFDGFQYGDTSIALASSDAGKTSKNGSTFLSPGTLWDLPSLPDSQKQVVTEKFIEFGYYPEFICNGYLNLWVDQWTVPISTITERTVSVVNVPGTLCYSGITTSVKLGGKKNVLIPGLAATQANAMLVKTNTSYSFNLSSNASVEVIKTGTDLAKELGFLLIEPINISDSLDVDLGYLNINDFQNSGYIWEGNTIIALYDGLFDDGRQWYTPQKPGTPDRTVEVDNDDTTSVVLCNLFALWSSFFAVYRKESVINLEEKEYSLHDLYPELPTILRAESWKLQVSAIDGIYTTVPFSAYFKNNQTGEIYFDFKKGENNLFLEFVLQKETRTAIQAISLKLGEKLVYHESYVTPEDWESKTILGTEFEISLV